MINEDLSRKDIAKIKKIIKQEIEKQEKKLQKNFRKENEEAIEEISLETLQKLFNMFYKERKTWQNKVKKF